MPTPSPVHPPTPPCPPRSGSEDDAVPLHPAYLALQRPGGLPLRVFMTQPKCPDKCIEVKVMCDPIREDFACRLSLSLSFPFSLLLCYTENKQNVRNPPLHRRHPPLLLKGIADSTRDQLPGIPPPSTPVPSVTPAGRRPRIGGRTGHTTLVIVVCANTSTSLHLPPA